ncbi:unnamed protein product [Brassica rapa subsp. trilocularis]
MFILFKFCRQKLKNLLSSSMFNLRLVFDVQSEDIFLPSK